MPELTQIAVIACSARFPGGIDSYETFREFLISGKNGIAEVPADRWKASDYLNTDTEAPGAINNTRGGFLDDIKGFDAGLFGISPAEAVVMDPQMRMALELSYELFSNAGHPLHKVKGSSTGVYIGSCFNDYRDLCYKHISEGVNSHTITGNTNCCISGRVSYYFGLEGPALTIDTACSSSLVAVHYAIRDLLSGDIDRAVAGGVNIMINPENHMAFTSLNALSPDGTCYSFDARANGYVRSDGVGMVLLRRLEDAIADGDNILAVIASSQVNNDGRSKSFTAPNPAAQEKLIRRAIEKAGCTIDDIDYIEAHGTGTYVGDPIELDAISRVFDGAGRTNPLYVGSVKSNIGHTESSSGIASLVKAIISVKEQTILPNIHFENPNPRFRWDSSCIKVPVAPIRSDKSLCVGVNSFGVSGTNVHQVIKAAPVLPSTEKRTQHSLPYLLPLSAADSETLIKRAVQVKDWLKEGNGAFAARVATLARYQTHLPLRHMVAGRDAADVIEQLNYFTEADIQQAPDLSKANKVFIFSGQGGLWEGMGKELIDAFPVFAESFKECAALTQELMHVELYEALVNIPTDEIARQALTFSYQLSLATLWVSLGIMPETVIGHSLGEIVAACFAGVLDKRAALQIVHARGKAINLVAGTGTMWVAGISASAYKTDYAVLFPGVDVAAINGPETIVLSGTETELQQFGSMLDEVEIFNRRTQINYASHSRYVKPALESFAADIPVYATGVASCRIFSTSTASYQPAEAFTKDYWLNNLQQPVQFTAALEQLIEERDIIGLEISSHALLNNLAAQVTDDKDHTAMWLPTCLKDQSELQSVITTISNLYLAGVDIDWDVWYAGIGDKKIAVPAYPFNKVEYWLGVEITDTPVIKQQRTKHNEVYDGVSWEELLTGLIAEITFLPVQKIKADERFQHLGLDSLMILKLRKRIEDLRSVKLKSTAFWNYPSIRSLAAYLTNKYPDTNNRPATDAYITPTITISSKGQITDDDVNKELDKLIADIL